MPLQDFFDRLTLTRRFVRSTERIATALEAQNTLLARIANHFAPELPEVTAADVATAGPAFRNQGQLARMEEWIDTFRVRLGRDPNEDDVAEWLEVDEERSPV